MKNKAVLHQFAQYKQTNTRSHAETKEERKRKEKRDKMAVLKHRWKKKRGRRGKYRDIIHPLTPEGVEGFSGNCGARPAFRLAVTATGSFTAREITPDGLGAQPYLPTCQPPCTIRATAALTGLNSGPNRCPSTLTYRSVSNLSVCCRGASRFFDFLILLFVLLSD